MTRNVHMLNNHDKLVIVMVGLPARGKSYIAKKLSRYLNWLHIETRIYNVGNRRRGLLSKDIEKPSVPHSSDFFDPDNAEAKLLREQVAMETLDELLDHILLHDGTVAILDATNSSRERRILMLDHIRQRGGPDLPVLFIESQCSNEQILMANMKLKLAGPDYGDQNANTALIDFSNRVKMYQKRYEALGEFEEAQDYSYCQMIDVGRKVTLHNIHGFLASQTVQYLQHFHLRPRQIWLTRSGESFDDVHDRVGGQASLTADGIEFAKGLNTFIREQRALRAASAAERSEALRRPQRCQVWISDSPSSVQTSAAFEKSTFLVKHVKLLDELNPGNLAGLTRSQIKEQHSKWFSDRELDKIRHRYPGTAGEGYHDVTQRLKSTILEVERVSDDVVLLSGLAVVRLLIAYFKGLKQEEIPDLDVPIGTVYMFEPKPYGIEHRECRWDRSTNSFSEVASM